jgi:hypothetical protein
MQNLAEKLYLQQTVEEPALADKGHPMILDVAAPIIFEKAVRILKLPVT